MACSGKAKTGIVGLVGLVALSPRCKRPPYVPLSPRLAFQTTPSSSSLDYLAFVDSQLVNEQERVEHCLDIDSMPRIIKVLEDELLLDQVEAIMDMPNGLNFLLEHQRIEGVCAAAPLNGVILIFILKCRRQCRNPF